MTLWPRIVVIFYILAIIILAMAFFIGYYKPLPGIGGEFYFPYLFVSGPIVWILSDVAAKNVVHLIEAISNYKINSVVTIIIVPGIFNIVFGSIQWYYLTKFAVSIRKKH